MLRRPNIAVARVEVTDGRVVLVNSDRAVSAHRWVSPRDAGAGSPPPTRCPQQYPALPVAPGAAGH